MGYPSRHTGKEIDNAATMIKRWIGTQDPQEKTSSEMTLNIGEQIQTALAINADGGLMVQNGISMRSGNDSNITTLHTGNPANRIAYYLPPAADKNANQVLALKSDVTLNNIMPGVTAPTGTGQLALKNDIPSILSWWKIIFAFNPTNSWVWVELSFPSLYEYTTNNWTWDTLYNVLGKTDKWHPASGVYKTPDHTYSIIGINMPSVSTIQLTFYETNVQTIGSGAIQDETFSTSNKTLQVKKAYKYWNGDANTASGTQWLHTIHVWKEDGGLPRYNFKIQFTSNENSPYSYVWPWPEDTYAAIYPESTITDNMGNTSYINTVQQSLISGGAQGCQWIITDHNHQTFPITKNSGSRYIYYEDIVTSMTAENNSANNNSESNSDNSSDNGPSGGGGTGHDNIDPTSPNHTN